jgi:hypothetical protein
MSSAYKIFSSILLLSIIFFSCGKKDVPIIGSDITKPIIDISSPAQGSVHNSAQSVYLIGVVTDNALDSVKTIVYNVTDTTVFFNKKFKSADSTKFIINQNFLRNTNGLTKQCLLYVEAKDRSQNTAVDSIFFFMN